MSSIECGGCAAPNGDHDRYCGACGAPLAVVEWCAAHEEPARWSARSGLLVAHPDARALSVRLRNSGVTAAVVVLRTADIQRLPGWVDREQVKEWVAILPPGAAELLRLPVRRERLLEYFERRDGEHPPDEVSGQLELLTTLSSTPLTVDLIVAREPRIHPVGSIYPFVPTELLDALVHELEVHNESAEALELLRVEVRDAELDGPVDLPRISASALVRRDGPALPTRIPPKGRLVERFVVRLPPQAPPVGWLAAEVLLHRRAPTGQVLPPLRAVVEASVGPGPSLCFDTPGQPGRTSIELGVAAENARAGLDVTLRNPGAVPVRVLRIDVERGDGTPAPHRDWLRLEGVAANATIGPGAAQTLHFVISPADRPADELRRQSCVRVVRIWHDGWPEAEHRAAVVRIQGRFDETLIDDHLRIGIDFGTSNSMVCVVRDSEWATLMVEHGPPPGEALPSLLYYDCSGKLTPGDDHFLAGTAAQNAAQVNPANLVRSIKSVIARDPGHLFQFECIGTDGALHFHPFTTQGLLDYFIDRLRRQAEQLVPFLDATKMRVILRQHTSVRFSQAVFTHPVEVTTETRQALWSAATHAGLAGHAQDVSSFSSNSCIDEATAAVLAYVYLRVYGQLKVELQPDPERVLCFDVGGGTTDVAAVAVMGMESFQAGRVEQVVVSLLATAGNARVGGDDVDTVVARSLVTEAAVQAEEAGAPIDTDELLRALECRSMNEYRQQYFARRPPSAALPTSASDPVYEIYAKALELRSKAEEVKRQLSVKDTSEVVLSSAGWPRLGAASGEAFRIIVTRRELEAPLGALAVQQLRLLDQAVSNAGWEWEEVTTLLFTGGGSLMSWLREQVLAHVKTRRAAPIPIVVQPGDRHHFDPKRCVALGAAVWGVSLADGGWIRVENRFERELTYDIERRFGPRYFKIPGLERGTPYPAEAVVVFSADQTSLTLYRDRGAEPLVVFHWDEPAREVYVKALGPSDLRVVVHGKERIGEKLA